MLFFLIFSFSLIILDDKEKIDFSYSHTKAVCNESECADYLIVCDNNGEVIEASRISGFVTFSEDWSDPRTEEQKSKVC